MDLFLILSISLLSSFLWTFSNPPEGDYSFIEKILYSIFISTVGNSLVLLFLHYTNLFSVTNIILGNIFVLVVLTIYISIFKLAYRKKDFLKLPVFKKSDWLLLAIITFLVVLLSRPSYFGLLSGNDSYSNLYEAIGITNQQYLQPNLPVVYQNIGLKLPYQASPELPLFPLWMAAFIDLFGLESVFYLNTFFLVIAIIALYLFVKSSFDRKIALVAVLIVSLNLGEILTTRTLLREIPSQAMLFGMLFLLNTSSLEFYGVSALVYFLGLFFRPEQLVLAPILALIMLFSMKVEKAIYLVFLTLFSAGFLILNIFVKPIRYFEPSFYQPFFLRWFGIFKPEFIFIAISLFLIMLILFWLFRKKIKSLVTSGKLVFIFTSMLFIYYDFIAPIFFYESPHFSNDITTVLSSKDINFDFISLERYGYFSPIISIVFGLIGFNYFLKTGKNRFTLSLSLFFLLLLFSSILTFYNPSHDPNIRLWIRRFVPIIIPGLSILFAVGLSYMPFSNKLKYLILALLVLIQLSILLPSGITQEYYPLFKELSFLSQKYNNKDLLVFSNPEQLPSDYKIAPVLSLVFNKEVYVVDNMDQSQLAKVVSDIPNRNINFITFDNSLDNICDKQFTHVINFSRFNWEFYTYPKNYSNIAISLNSYNCQNLSRGT